MKIENQYFEGERPLFAQHDSRIVNTTFGTGESPLKEGRNLELSGDIFQWKYPLWYCRKVTADHMVFEEMSRSGIWYTHDISLTDSNIQAPKEFRRCSGITLKNDHFSNAAETLWNCDDIRMTDVQINGDYFGMNSTNIYAERLNVIGNYVFDGAKNVEVHDSTFVSKDAFWNCENVVIYDSVIDGEYLAWNTKNLTLINCTIESDQGLCYVEHLTLRNCKLLHTNLAFEYCSDIDADVRSRIDSVKNPESGVITADGIDDIIMDPTAIDPMKTHIVCRDRGSGNTVADSDAIATGATALGKEKAHV